MQLRTNRTLFTLSRNRALALAAALISAILTAPLASRTGDIAAARTVDSAFHCSCMERVARRDGSIVYERRPLVRERSELSRDQQLARAVWAGNFDEVQSLIAAGANVNGADYPFCGPKDYPIRLAVNLGSPLMLRLMIQHGGKLDYTLHNGYTSPGWGWIKRDLIETAELDMQRPDLVQILRNRQGLRGRVRTIGALNEWFAFEPYSAARGVAALVPGGASFHAITGKWTQQYVCRVKGPDGQRYGNLLFVNGQPLCDARRDPEARTDALAGAIEALYFKRRLGPNHEIVWRERDADGAAYRASFQPEDIGESVFFRDDKNYTGFTASGIYTTWYRYESLPKSAWGGYQWASSFLTLVEFTPEGGGTPTTTEDPARDMALLQAAHRGDAAAVRSALQNGANPDARYQGWTALMYAAYYGRLAVVMELLRFNANTELDINGYRAVDFARSRGHAQIERLLATSDRSLAPRPAHRSLPADLIQNVDRIRDAN